MRADSSALELTLYGPNSQILATTAVDSQAAVPKYPSDEVVFQLRQSQMYVSIEPQPGGLYQIVAAAPLNSQPSRGELEFLQAIFPMDPQARARSRTRCRQATRNSPSSSTCERR